MARPVLLKYGSHLLTLARAVCKELIPSFWGNCNENTRTGRVTFVSLAVAEFNSEQALGWMLSRSSAVAGARIQVGRLLGCGDAPALHSSRRSGSCQRVEAGVNNNTTAFIFPCLSL